MLSDTSRKRESDLFKRADKVEIEDLAPDADNFER